jgi:hypothetical protein
MSVSSASIPNGIQPNYFKDNAMDMDALADCKENRFVHLRHFLLHAL